MPSIPRLHKLLYLKGGWKLCEKQIEILTKQFFFTKVVMFWNKKASTDKFNVLLNFVEKI